MGIGKNRPPHDIPVSSGKLPPALLSRLLSLPRKATRPDVLVGPSPGEDAAVLTFGEIRQVVTTDPITFPTPLPGYYAVHINANDIAVMGGTPVYFTLTIIVPPHTSYMVLEEIWQQAVQAADSLNIVLLGGHTEASPAVNTPILSVTMIGELITAQPILTGNGQPGDVVVQVNPMAVEGTSILASEHEARLKNILAPDEIERAGKFYLEPGLSVVKPALLAARHFQLHAMHDPTEGGMATGLREIAQASGTGLAIKRDKLIVEPLTATICRYLDYDPLGLISSGCLLIAVSEDVAPRIVKALNDEGFPAADIGRLTKHPGEYLMENETGQQTALPAFDADELAGK
jgi:hydrogenase expression/formation protein HypE